MTEKELKSNQISWAMGYRRAMKRVNDAALDFFDEMFFDGGSEKEPEIVSKEFFTLKEFKQRYLKYIKEHATGRPNKNQHKGTQG